jgi:DNA-binding NarL/FixJ family response regulator
LFDNIAPDVLLIEPFLENRDAIRWIKDLATEFPRIRILVVSRQSERTYAERALCAGASGYWMKNSSVAELMHAIETVLTGEIYASQAITGLAMQRFAGGRNLPPGLVLRQLLRGDRCVGGQFHTARFW